MTSLLFGATARPFARLWKGLVERPRLAGICLVAAYLPLILIFEAGSTHILVRIAVSIPLLLLATYSVTSNEWNGARINLLTNALFFSCGIMVAVLCLALPPLDYPLNLQRVRVYTVIWATGTVGIALLVYRLSSTENYFPNRLIVLVAVLGGLRYFVQWPPVIFGTVFRLCLLAIGVVFFRSAGTACNSASQPLGIVWHLAVLAAVIGFSGASLAPVSIDPHHEAETILPAYLMWSGWLPFRDFTISHSVATDCLSSLAGFPIWEPSVYAERMARNFLWAPLRTVLIWLLLRELFEETWAIVMLVMLAGIGIMRVQTNEALRLEPALIVLICYIKAQKIEASLYLYLAAALAPLSAVISPEIGIPLALGISVAFITGGACVRSSTSGLTPKNWSRF